MRAEDRILLRLQVAVAADDLFDLALDQPAFGICDDAHAHLFSGCGAFSADDAHFIAKAPLVRADDPAPPTALIDADDAPHAATDNGIDGCLVAAAAADDAREHLVAVQRPAARARGDKQIPFRPQQKGKTALARLQRAAHEPQFFGRDAAPALVPHDLPLLFERAQQPLQLRAFAPRRDAEQAADLIRLFILQRARMKLF